MKLLHGNGILTNKGVFFKMEDRTKCAHEPCVCPTMEDSDYCGQFCEDAGDSDIVEIKCACGHPCC